MVEELLLVVDVLLVGIATGVWWARPRPVHLEPTAYRFEWELALAELELPEPWRHGRFAAETIRLDTAVVAGLADPARMQVVHREQERLERVRETMPLEGVHEPLELVVDDGRIRLKNGYHRLTVALEHDIGRLPVRFTRSEGIRGWCRPVGEVFTAIVLDRHAGVAQLAEAPRSERG